MAIGLEAKGYKESETRAGKRHRNSQKVAKRDERAQELSHKASHYAPATRLGMGAHTAKYQDRVFYEAWSSSLKRLGE
jgi:hypothetical protein